VDNGAELSAYLQSPYLIEVVVALLLGIALIFLVRRGRRVDWPPSSAWRRFLVYVGWFFAAAAFVTWCLVIWIVVEAWIDSINPNIPKKPSLVFLIFGGMLYFTLAGISGSAFDASSGSARSEIMRRIGRRDG
jgi:hypothetical protein